MNNQEHAIFDLYELETWNGTYEPANELDLLFEVVTRCGERIDVTLLAVRDGAEDLLDRITSAQRDRLEEELMDLLGREEEYGARDRWEGRE